jgi:predicted GH43/DUF377 family glycosyl hydrolase
MYTFGGNSETALIGELTVIGGKMEIGVAVSNDGAHWSRVEGPSAYLSVLEVGQPGEFDSLFVGWPCVLEIGSQYRMYYHTFNEVSKKFIVGMAVAKDGLLKWTKQGAVFSGSDDPTAFDAGGASRRHVVKLPDNSYKMFYEGVSVDRRKHAIGIATSKDGIVWERSSNTPVFTASADSWDSGGVGSPHVIFLSDRKVWRMYYVGTPDDGTQGSWNGIGVAESTDETGTVFNRISL